MKSNLRRLVVSFLVLEVILSPFGPLKINRASAASAPVFIQEAEASWNSSSTKTTPSFSVQAGDVLVAYAAMEDEPGTLAISGGTLTWTEQQNINTAAYTEARIWTATVDTNKSMSVTFTNGGSNNFFG